MGKYILMNQNKEVLKFEFDEDLNVITKIDEIYNLDYAPLNIKNKIDEKKLLELNDWFNDRGIPIYRDNVKEILEAFNINSIKELTAKNYSLSVSDQYWFKPYKQEIQWREINYFNKDYNSIVFANSTFGSESGKLLCKNNKQMSNKTPNNTSNGQLKKVWIKQDNQNYLYKGSGTIHNVEPINEELASSICQILEVPHVKYTIDVISSKRQDTLVSVCKCFINENEEIIPAYSILTEKQDEVEKNINDYNLYLEILNIHNVPKAEEYLQKMFMLDYIVLNEDRHLSNFGVIRNVQTLEWERICPIFDTGRSMNTNVTTSYWDFEEGEVKCFSSELVSSKNLEGIFTIKITNKQITKLKELSKTYKSNLVKYQEYTKLSNYEIEKLTEGYLKRVNIFEKVMSQKNILI